MTLTRVPDNQSSTQHSQKIPLHGVSLPAVPALQEKVDEQQKELQLKIADPHSSNDNSGAENDNNKPLQRFATEGITIVQKAQQFNPFTLPHVPETEAKLPALSCFSIQPGGVDTAGTIESKPFQLKEDKQGEKTFTTDSTSQRIVQRTIFNGTAKLASEQAAIVNVTNKLKGHNTKISDDKIKAIVKLYFSGAKRAEKTTTDQIVAMLIQTSSSSGSTSNIRGRQTTSPGKPPQLTVPGKKEKGKEIDKRTDPREGEIVSGLEDDRKITHIEEREALQGLQDHLSFDEDEQYLDRTERDEKEEFEDIEEFQDRLSIDEEEQYLDRTERDEKEEFEDIEELQKLQNYLSIDFDEDEQHSGRTESDEKEEMKSHESVARDSDDRPGQWGSYLEKNAINDPVQRFGLEIELKLSKIAYGDKQNEDGFYKFAVSKGHIDIARSRMPGLEVHLDHLDVNTAIFEIVLKPGLPLNEFIPKLDYIKSNLLNKSVNKDWFDKFFIWSGHVETSIREYIYENMKGTTQIKGMPVQITTTHTGKELRNVLEATNEEYIKSNGFKTKLQDINTKKPKKSEYRYLDEDQFIINEYLGKLSTLKERRDNGKGGSAIIKHAAEQFNIYEPAQGSPSIPEATPVVRIKKGGSVLENLHTYSNKPAPVFKRNGQIAYVVEYRTNSKIASTVNNYLLGKIEKPALMTTLSEYVGKKKK